MKLIIKGEVTPTEKIAIYFALEFHKQKYNQTGLIVNHKIKIGQKIYPIEIQNCKKTLIITMRNKRQRL